MVSRAEIRPVTEKSSGKDSIRDQLRTWTSAPAARGLIGFILLFGTWQGLAMSGLIEPTILPPPSDVIEAGQSSIADGTLLENVVASLQRVVAGYVVGAALGILLGVLTGGSVFFRQAISPMLELIRPIPPIAWIPLAVLWFGIGNAPAIFIVALSTVFLVYVTTAAAVESIDRVYLNAAKSLGATRWMLVKDVAFKAILVQILTALRVGLGGAWIAVVAAELVGADSGLGYMIQLNQQLLRTDQVIVGMITIGVIGFAMNWLMMRAQVALTPWERTARR